MEVFEDFTFVSDASSVLYRLRVFQTTGPKNRHNSPSITLIENETSVLNLVFPAGLSSLSEKTYKIAG